MHPVLVHCTTRRLSEFDRSVLEGTHSHNSWEMNAGGKDHWDSDRPGTGVCTWCTAQLATSAAAEGPAWCGCGGSWCDHAGHTLCWILPSTNLSLALADVVSYIARCPYPAEVSRRRSQSIPWFPETGMDGCGQYRGGEDRLMSRSCWHEGSLSCWSSAPHPSFWPSPMFFSNNNNNNNNNNNEDLFATKIHSWIAL